MLSRVKSTGRICYVMALSNSSSFRINLPLSVQIFTSLDLHTTHFALLPLFTLSHPNLEEQERSKWLFVVRCFGKAKKIHAVSISVTTLFFFSFKERYSKLTTAHISPSGCRHKARNVKKKVRPPPPHNKNNNNNKKTISALKHFIKFFF